MYKRFSNRMIFLAKDKGMEVVKNNSLIFTLLFRQLITFLFFNVMYWIIFAPLPK
jgi:hypothetical protein